MNKIASMLLTLLACNTAWGHSNFVSNPWLPYPPSCGRIPEMDSAGRLAPPAINFFDRNVEVWDVQTGALLPLRLRAYRSPCSEPNRSMVWLVYTLNAQEAEDGVELTYPTIAAQMEGEDWYRWVNLAAEPNSWGAGSDTDRVATYLAASQQTRLAHYDPLPENGKRRWMFLVDSFAPLSEWWPWADAMTPSEYNGPFKLIVMYGSEPTTLAIDVPATLSLWPTPPEALTLSGRLSGNWVIEGAADQGVMLSISERLPSTGTYEPNSDDLSMVIFLAHYTFDSAGRMLWLTGSADFEQGAGEISIPMEYVTDGVFRGSQAAHRELVGSVTIRANHCDNLSFQFDYSGIGLGSGQKRLQRLFSLETAGYDCRDYEARVMANP